MSLALGPATYFLGGGGPCGADDADAAFIFGVFAATFAAALLSVGYDDVAAAAFTGGGVFARVGVFARGGAAGFTVGGADARDGDLGFAGEAFAGFGGGWGVCLVFDASRRLDASICKSLGGGFSIENASSAMALALGILALRSAPLLLDLAFRFGGGADAGLPMTPVSNLFLRLRASSLASDGMTSIPLVAFDAAFAGGG